MGQYFLVANLNKLEYIHPHQFDDGAKLQEFSSSSMGTMTALALLLRRSDDCSGWPFDQRVDGLRRIGSWAGDRIVIIGDGDQSGFYADVKERYTDISLEVRAVVETKGAVYD